MNMTFIRPLLAAGAVALVLSGCSAKFRQITSQQVNVNPTPLAVTGDQVPARIRIAFPAKSFPRKATLHITPVLRYAGGEKWGAAFACQGEKVRGNEVTIPYANGANIEINFSVPYTPAMLRSELYLVFQAKVGSKSIKMADLKVADGVIATEALATIAGIYPAVAPHGFERIIKQAYDTDIMFDMQQANVRSSELNKEDVEEWRYIVQNANETPNQNVSVEVQSYASPDGNQDLNEQLSSARERNTTTSLRQNFRRNQLEGVDIDAHYTAEDWEGFRELVEESDLPDKALVLRILSMYPDAESREREIKNISVVFRQLADEVLPKLRRSRLVANVEIVGKTDEEIQEWIEKAPGFLTIEELLYAAHLSPSSEEKLRILQLVNHKYPRDFRPLNNIGALLYSQGKIDQAELWFTQAANRADNPVTKLNRGLVALSKGQTDAATTLIASGTNLPELGQALGYLYLKRGEYTKAVTAYGDTVSDNAAVAHLLAGDYARALRTIDALDKPTAHSYLIRAVISARMNDEAGVVSGIQKAAELDSTILRGLGNRLEFSRYLSHPTLARLISMH